MSYGSTPPPPPPGSGGFPPPPGGDQDPSQGYGQQPPAYGQPAGYPVAPAGYPAAPVGGGYYEQAGPGALASWGQRAIGMLVDMALYIPGYLLLFLGTPKVDARGNVGSFGITYFIGMLYMLGVQIWNRWIKGGQGQTVGRKIAGVTLVNAQGQPLGAGMAFVRDLAHIVDSLICYVGWLFPLWDAKRQTMADKILNTSVINVPK